MWLQDGNSTSIQSNGISKTSICQSRITKDSFEYRIIDSFKIVMDEDVNHAWARFPIDEKTLHLVPLICFETYSNDNTKDVLFVVRQSENYFLYSIINGMWKINNALFNSTNPPILSVDPIEKNIYIYSFQKLYKISTNLFIKNIQHNNLNLDTFIYPSNKNFTNFWSDILVIGGHLFCIKQNYVYQIKNGIDQRIAYFPHTVKFDYLLVPKYEEDNTISPFQVNSTSLSYKSPKSTSVPLISLMFVIVLSFAMFIHCKKKMLYNAI